MAGKDELAKSLKGAFLEKPFAVFLSMEMMNEDYDEQRQLDEFFEFLEYSFTDAADGLVLSDEQEGEMSETLKNFQRISTASKLLNAPLNEFASQLKPDKSHQAWIDFLKSDLARFFVAREHGIGGGAKQSVEQFFEEHFEENDSQELELNEESIEEMTEIVRMLFRNYRNFRRQSRPIAELAKKMVDKQLGEQLDSMAGKVFFVESIERRVDRRHFDGLQIWIGQHFEKTDSGYVIRDGASETIQEMIDQAEEMKKELAKDDF